MAENKTSPAQPSQAKVGHAHDVHQSENKPKRAIQPDMDEDGNVFGNEDKKKEYPFKPGWLEMVVVRQSRIETLASGTKVEDPSSVRIMPYEPTTFKALQKNEGFGDLKVVVLHQP